MNRICINGRDELIIIDLSKVAFFKADVDYTILYFISGMTTTLPLNLARIEALLIGVPKSKFCDFIRLGRSAIINQGYLFRIQTLHQKLILSDGVKMINVTVSKDALKKYKQFIAQRYSPPRNSEV